MDQVERSISVVVSAVVVTFCVCLFMQIVFVDPQYNACRKDSKSCRMQHCARLVTTDKGSECEEWKP